MDVIKLLNQQMPEGGLALPCRQSAQMSLNDIQAKLNELEEMKSTEITVTFKNQLHDHWLELSLKEILESTIRKALRKAPTNSKLILVGEHSNTGRFHYHGIALNIPNDFIAKLKRTLTRQIGRTEIKQISYFESYKIYMVKSYKNSDQLPELWGPHSYININI